jgi:hypothetical protein
VWTFSLRICVAFGQPSCRSALHCVGAPNLRTCGRALRCGRALHYRSVFRLGAHVADVSCVAFRRPSCGCAFRCVAAPNLAKAILKILPPSQNLFLSILQLIFFPSAPFGDTFIADDFFVWAPILRTRLVLHLGTQLADMPCVVLGRPTCGRVDVPSVCVADVRWGAQLADVP